MTHPQTASYPSSVPGRVQLNRLSILNALKASERPLASAAICEHLKLLGLEMSERTVRLYLQTMARDGLVRASGRGHAITDRGLEELHSTSTASRVGFFSARIDRMTYRMDFDLVNRTGNVIANITMVKYADLLDSIEAMYQVFHRGYAMGKLLALFGPGERMGFERVPDGMIGIGTVCSVSLNGVLLKYGIPTSSRFGALLELDGGKPSRLVEIITYEGTTVDPLQVFISAGMTDYLGAILNGKGRIGVGFREFPAESRERVIDLAAKLERAGLGGFLRIGWPGQPLLDVPVSEGRFGAIVIGGLNPVAVFEEKGIRLRSRAMEDLVSYDRLFPYEELSGRARALVRDSAEQASARPAQKHGRTG